GDGDRYAGSKKGGGGGGGWRKKGGARGEGFSRRASARTQRRKSRVGRGRYLYKKISRPPPPYRNPGAWRRRGKCHSPWRARLLPAATSPEGLGRRPFARTQRGRA